MLALRVEFLPSEGLEVSGESGKPRYVLVARVCTAVLLSPSGR